MMISYQISPEEYKHWKLEVSNKVAFLILDIDEDGDPGRISTKIKFLRPRG